MSDKNTREKLQKALAAVHAETPPAFAEVWAAAERQNKTSRKRYAGFVAIAAAVAIGVTAFGLWSTNEVEMTDEFLIADALMNSGHSVADGVNRVTGRIVTMRQGTRNSLTLLGICLVLFTTVATAQGIGKQKDVFKDKLFAPNIILENQDELDLSKEQFTAIRAAVVEVQGNVAEHEWDLREAYMKVMADLDEVPVDEDKVMANVQAALLAENEVKKLQVAMLIRLRNLLTDEQMQYLQSLRGN